MDIYNDYDILGVRVASNSTYHYRRHSTLTPLSLVQLRAIQNSANTVLEVIRVVKMLLIIAVVTIALEKRIANERVIREFSKLMTIILPLLEMCENEVDKLVGMEIDILSI